MVNLFRRTKLSIWTILAVLLLTGASANTYATQWYWQDLFLTRDQQARILFYQRDYRGAARRFEDPQWRALALYAAQDFRGAADLWTQLPGADALFNRGNALAHMKDYRGAADSYMLALQIRPLWPQAQANLELVQALAKEPKELDEYIAQSEGKLEADDFTFDQGGKRMENALEETDAVASSTSTKEIQAIWMERLQSTPAEFLSLKFRYQLETSQQGEQP